MIHAEIPPVAVKRQDGSDAVLGVDPDVSWLWQGEVEYLLIPGQTLLNVHESKHQCLVPPEGPCVFIELGH